MRRTLAGTLLILSLVATACDPSMLAGVQKSGDANPSSTSVAPKEGTLKGVLLSPEGKPVEGAKVRAFAVPSDLTTVAPLQQAAAGYATSRRIAAASGEVITDKNGAFAFPDLEGKVNVEAVMSDAFKLFKSDVMVSKAQPTSLGEVTVQPTGTIMGKVSSKDNSAVSDFEGVDVFIPGSSYVAKADSAGNFTLANVAPGTFTLVATKTGLGRAYASSITVLPKSSSNVNLALSLSLPKIAQLAPNNGGPGAEVTLTGENFGATKGEQLQVFFNGSLASGPLRQDDGTIKVRVPEGAVNGNVSITVGGNQSNAVPFKVIKDVSLGWSALDLLVGASHASTATAKDTANNLILAPALQWAIVSGDSVELSGPTVTALRSGSSTLKVFSGSVASVGTVNSFEVTGVSLDKTSLVLNAPPSVGNPDPGFVTSGTLTATVQSTTGPLNRPVQWSSSDTALVTVQNGLVKAVPNAPKGTATIRATSVDAPGFSAEATVTVTIYGDIDLEVK